MGYAHVGLLDGPDKIRREADSQKITVLAQLQYECRFRKNRVISDAPSSEKNQSTCHRKVQSHK